jgi:hypothetical protein
MEATRKLLDRARSRMKGKDLRPFVAFDPGVYGYAAAFDSIVKAGDRALTDIHDGVELHRSFDFTEAVGLTRWGRPHEPDARWFRVLTCAAHLAARPLGETEIPLNYSLVALVSDALTLSEEGDADAPLDLLPDVFGEARQSVLRGEGDPWDSLSDEAFCVLAELLVRDDADPDLAEALRARLEELDALSSEYYLPGTSDLNPHFAANEAFVWGLTVFDQLHADWLALVVERFPKAPSTMAQTRAKLIESGAKWASKSPRL